MRARLATLWHRLCGKGVCPSCGQLVWLKMPHGRPIRLTDGRDVQAHCLWTAR